MNIFSLILIFLSILIILLKGLNLGVDFKGGTLIELRVENSSISISEIRQSFLKMKLEFPYFNRYIGLNFLDLVFF